LKLPAQAAAGRYRVQVGVFRAENERVLPFRDASDALETELEVGEIIVVPAQPPLATTKLGHAFNAQFGDAIELIGYEFEGAEPTQSFAPGASISVVLAWRARQAQARDYTVFAHLIAPDGQLVAQSDHLPAHGTYPTSVWQAGEIVRDAFALNLPTTARAGEYTLWVGWYEYPSLKRLPALVNTVQQAEGAVPVLTLRVKK